jgi:poly(hydroxyalkanoate) depolymerase family esterase
MYLKTSLFYLITPVTSIGIAILLLIAGAIGCERAKNDSVHHYALVEVASFGSNPGQLQMFKYVPSSSRPNMPLVVVMHGCAQNAQDFADHSGWPQLADEMKFVLVFPQQPIANNPARCFHWYRSEDSTRDSGEALSVKQMVDQVKQDHGVDPARVYVTGLSAGGAMTNIMLAAYPEVFAGGAVMSGLPYKCAAKMAEMLSCMQSDLKKTPAQWGDLVRNASAHHRGSWPVVSIWHGTADRLIGPVNAREEMEQWTNVHGLSQKPSQADLVNGFPHQAFKTAAGKTVVEVYSITNMGHGQAIHPNRVGGCGSPEAFFFNVGICSAFYTANFWELQR